jgi:hypothetical protein
MKNQNDKIIFFPSSSVAAPDRCRRAVRPWHLAVVTALLAAALLALPAGPVGAQTLMDRYSFSSGTANDSVGSNNGTIVGTGGISGGTLTLDGNTYMSLPAGTIASNYTALTLEIFANLAQTQDAGGSLPTVLAYFGDSAGDSFCRLVTKASSTASWVGYQDQWNGEWWTVAAWPIAGNVHLVGVWNTTDPDNQYVLFYENGILLSSNSIFVGGGPLSVAGAADQINYIGANIGPMFFPTGTIAEVRIYNGELTIDQIRASFAAGPANIPLAGGTINPGAVTSVSVSVHPNFIAGTVADPVVTASTATVTNINLTYVPDVTFTSGDSSILAVLPNNQVQAVGAGVTTLTATYQGVSNQTSVTVIAAPAQAMLTHEYSFTSDASDSVSGENGTLMGDAAITSGALDLTPNGLSTESGTSGAFLSLPRDVITGYPAVTVEMWVNLGQNFPCCRLLDVGSWSPWGGDSSVFLLSPDWCSPNATVLLMNPAVGNDAGNNQAVTSGVLNNVGEVQVVGVCDPVTLQVMEVYTNGVLAADAPTLYTLSEITNQYVGTGMSFGFGDPEIYGYVDEMRLYYGALSAAQIAADFQAGPNSTSGTPGALLSISANFPTNMLVGQQLNLTVLGNYANVGGVVVSPAAAYSSGNGAVASVTAAGLITALASGTAELTVTFGGFTVTQYVTVVPSSAVLMDRYSFAVDATDSVGANNGQLEGDAAIAGGGGVSLPDGGGYVSLPAGTITSNYTALTMEIFANVSQTADGYPTVIAYFGNSVGSSYCRMVTKADNTHCWLGYAADGGPDAGEYRAWPPGPVAGNVHLVGIWDPAFGYMLFYKNGILIASNPLPAGLPLADMAGANDQQTYIGANQGGGIGITGTINEFRIYNGVLSIDQIRASMAAGPANIPLTNGTINPGPVTGVSVSVHPNFIAGTVADPVVMASTATVTNINLTCVPDVTFTSGNTNFIVVLANNQIQAVGTGTTTLTATYQGVSNQTSVTIIPAPAQPMLTHEYSFTSDATDSVSGENGILMGDAAITGGTLDLTGNGDSGTGAGTSGAYCSLPRDVITGYPAATVEMWVNLETTAAQSRLFDVGSYFDQNTAGDSSAFILSPTWGGTSTELIINPQSGEDGDVGNNQAAYGSLLANLGEVQIVGVATSSSLQLYLNGSLVALGPNTYSLLSVSNLFATIGQSYGDNDPYASGYIDEARLYYGALSPAQIAADNSAGPNSTNGTPGALVSVTATIPSTILLHTSSNVVVIANYATVSGVNVTGAASIVSSNTSLVSVSPGQLSGAELGSTTVTVSFGGTNFSQTVTVVPANPAVLMDRYSFWSGNANDSVGADNGTVVGSGGFANGNLVLNGSTYVTLPAGTITTNYAALTMEVFANVNRTADNVPTVMAYLGNSAGTSFCRMVTKANSCNCWLGYAANDSPEYQAWPPGPIAGNVHLVGVFNLAFNYMLFYRNGILIASNSLPAGVPLSDMTGGNDSANYIGANLGGGISPTGTINEFRIYSGELTVDQIRASMAAGSTNIPLADGTINPGAITSVSVSVHPFFIAGTLADPTVMANTATVSNINLTYVPDVNFTSGDTNVILVLANNQIQAVGAGTTTLSAAYQGVTNQTSVTVIAAPAQAMLTHRYGFATDASDSASGENGILMGGATITSGALNLTGNGNSGNSGGTSGAYVSLPRDVITGYPAATVEMWVNLQTTASGSRLFDVGSYISASANTDEDANDSSAFILSPAWGTSTELIINPTVGGDAGNDQAIYSHLLAGLGEVQIVGVATSNSLRLYLNGALVATGTNTYSLLSVSEQFAVIGQSFGQNAPYVCGTIYEARLYYGALSSNQIAQDYALGPKTAPPVSLTAAVSGQSLLINWPAFAYAFGFTLESSPALAGPEANWQPVAGTPTSNGSVLTLSVPLSGSAQFFRLVN